MSTIAGGQLAGMSRASALEFSFFLSIPTMIAATGYTLLKSVMGKGENPIGVSQITSNQWLLAGDWVCGFISGRLCVGGVVHGLGEKARVCALCGVSDRRGNSGAGVRGETCWLTATDYVGPAALGCSAERSLAGACR